MTDIPIIFSGPMVRAWLAGNKLMTRRLAWQPSKRAIGVLTDPKDREAKPTPWQKVKPGDRLWIRETWCEPEDDGNFVYRADLSDGQLQDERDVMRLTRDKRGPAYRPWRSPIHCPRAASRLTLIVGAVKIERLKDISEDDAKAEGAVQQSNGFWSMAPGEGPAMHQPISAFWAFWNRLHGAGAWDANPWVVAITASKIIKANIDAAEARAA